MQERGVGSDLHGDAHTEATCLVQPVGAAGSTRSGDDTPVSPVLSAPSRHGGSEDFVRMRPEPQRHPVATVLPEAPSPGRSSE